MNKDQYYVLGNPISHSLSPQIHQYFAQQTHQSLNYDRLLVDLGHFKTTVDQIRANDAKGASVTLPFKLDAYHYADDLTLRAQCAGAVNTLKFTPDGRCLGDNTDGAGLVNDIKNNLNWPIKGKRILILGAGGAVRGVLKVLLDEHPQILIIANRTPEKALELAQLFAKYGPISAHPGSLETMNYPAFDLIINGTSASLQQAHLPIPVTLIGSETACYDMFYSAKSTVFLDASRELGSQYLADGLGMLVEQAAEAFYIWRNVRPLTSPVIKALRTQIAAKEQ